MHYLTDPMFTNVISALPQFFDSHAVIRGLMSKYPQEYVKELNANVASSDPIRETHRQIGQHIGSIRNVQKNTAIGRVESTNIRGPVTENQAWRH